MRAGIVSINYATEQSDYALWRKVVSFILFLSFFWISYVAQTHIHGKPAPATMSAISKSLPFAGEKSVEAPEKDQTTDDINCQLCQAVSHGRALLLPLLITLLAVWLTLHAAPPGNLEWSWTSIVGHDHQARGPPTL
ncbi:MAG: hypothetical protein WA821_24210 [Anaerolineales bacterium]